MCKVIAHFSCTYAHLLDYLIGQEEEGGRHRDPERLGGLEVDHQRTAAAIHPC